MLLSVNGAAMMWSGGAPRGYLPDNFRMFGRFVFHDVPVIKIFPLAIVVLAVVRRSPGGGCMGRSSGDGCSRSAIMPRAARLAGVRVDLCALGVFVISALRR